MPDIGKAFVQIVPSAKGISGSIENLLGGEAESAGKSAGLNIAAGIAGALTAGTAAIGKIVTDSVSGYANYEQLVGGVETLFKDSAGVVQDYAAGAYQTAGLSANEYMETVTSFSASLLQSLGGNTEEAARIGDMAITDMADNANKMGSDMASIQVAYQGFAKQNYTMLDNLKLGYGGTKGEMERLLADAEELSGIEYNIDSLSDVYEAIHVVQGELGISGRTAEEAAEIIARTGRSEDEVFEQLGTTAKEASSTISGSLGMTSAAWQNLLVGFADGNADLSGLIGNLVDSASTAFGNLMPVVEQALSGITDFVGQIAPVIAEALPSMITSVVPQLVTAGGQLVIALVQSFAAAAPSMAQAGVDIVVNLANGLAEALPDLISAAAEAIAGVAAVLADPGNLDALLNAGMAIIDALVNGILEAVPGLVEALPGIITGLVEFITAAVPQIAEAGVTLLSGITQNMQAIISAVTAALPGIVQGIADALPGMVGAIVEAGVLLLGALVQNAEAIISAVTDALPGIIQSIADAFPGMVGLIAEAGVTLLGALVQNAEAIISAVAEALPELIVGIVNALTDEENMQQIIEAGITLLGELLADIPAILGALAKGISDLIVGLINCLLGGDNQNSIANGGTELMGHLPDRWGSIDIDVGEIIQKIIASIGSYFSDIWEAGKNLAMGLWEGVKNGFNQGGEYNGQVSWVEGKIDKMVDGVEKRLDIHSPSGVFRDIGENMAKGLQVGWDDTFFGVQRDIESSLDFDSQQLSAGITAAQEDRLNGADGAAYYIDRVEIDASSIREFEDVLTAIDNSRRLKRMVKA